MRDLSYKFKLPWLSKRTIISDKKRYHGRKNSGFWYLRKDQEAEIMRAYERLLEYVKVKTPSSEENMETPSSSCQFELAERLVGEMKELGIEDAAVDGKCYVYGTIPATEGYENSPSLGFIAHMDTVSEFTENPIHPVLHKNYDGQNLVFDEGGRVLDTVLFPHLKNLKGRTLITSDGTTILGADDKAGIAEIMTMAEYVLRSDVPHGKICLAFTPDEEIGRGADHFDVEGFAADFAYTVDGGAEGEIEYENFNACEAVFKIQGVNVHPFTKYGGPINHNATDPILLIHHILHTIAIEYACTGMYCIVQKCRSALYRVHGIEFILVWLIIDAHLLNDLKGFLLDHNFIEHHCPTPHTTTGGELAVELCYLKPGLCQIVSSDNARWTSANNGNIEVQTII